MEKEQVMNKLTEIFRELFESEELMLTDETTAKDIDGWDSLSHLQLMHSVEAEFKIRFTLGEINNFKNVGEMCGCIIKHLSK